MCLSPYGAAKSPNLATYLYNDSITILSLQVRGLLQLCTISVCETVLDGLLTALAGGIAVLSEKFGWVRKRIGQPA